jgi:hypothetical protein
MIDTDRDLLEGRYRIGKPDARAKAKMSGADEPSVVSTSGV